MGIQQDWKTVGFEILETHRMDCGDGSCGCGCFPFVLSTVELPEKPAQPQECCEPASGLKTYA